MKLAVIFPGIGYHTDKPLLYYGKKLAASYGYEIVKLSYQHFPEKVKDSKEKMQQSVEIALEQTEEKLKKIKFSQYEDILFISKSIGTAVAATFAKNHRIPAHHIFYTPVEPSFAVMNQNGIVFHGTKDPWIDTSLVKEKCAEKRLPLVIIENANHSLETGDVLTDLKNLIFIMEHTKQYCSEIDKKE
ncbi:MAG TPA: alpha/beta hydrolase [Candidatus Fimimorpha faecalis]|uniref:Alpha/beta hydrolase n=1 Tax=Candidatus Fimimorpha faecalis TaxID=2840824 RepID=A0A9D1EE57_9FIRM|nr:alpha/beta hydrolase [Candidatus Fimimorpha faecalis]